MKSRISFLRWLGALVGICVAGVVLCNLIYIIIKFVDSDDHYPGLPKASPEVLESAERALNGEVLVIYSDGRKEWRKAERGVEAVKEYEEMKAEIEKQVQEFKAKGRE